MELIYANETLNPVKMKSSERNQFEIEKREKKVFYELSVDEMFKIRGGGNDVIDPGKLK